MQRKFQNMAAALLATAFVVLPAMASAQLTPDSTGLKTAAARTGLSTSCSGTDCLTIIVGNTINVVLGFLGIVLFAMLVYAGWQWMTAGGDSKQVQEAKARIFNAIAGLVIIAASYAIATFVLSSLASLTAGGVASGGAVGATCSTNGDCPSVTCPATAGSAAHVAPGQCLGGECGNPGC